MNDPERKTPVNWASVRATAAVAGALIQVVRLILDLLHTDR